MSVASSEAVGTCELGHVMCTMTADEALTIMLHANGLVLPPVKEEEEERE